MKGKVKVGAKAVAQIVKARKPEVVWSHADFGGELEKAKRIGPKKMSNDDLVKFCHRVTVIIARTSGPMHVRSSWNFGGGSMPANST